MTCLENNLNDDDRARADSVFRFAATLIVTTIMVAVTALVLSYAVVASERPGSPHSAAGAISHARLQLTAR